MLYTSKRRVERCAFVLGVVAALGASAHAATLDAPRAQAYAGYTRLVLDLPEGAKFALAPMGAVMELRVDGVDPGISSSTSYKFAELRGFATTPSQNGVVLSLVTPQGVSARNGYRQQVLGPAAGKTGSRLVLDFSGGFADISPLGVVEAFVFKNAKAESLSVLLDPGHGGVDKGALGAVTEKDLNLTVALQVREELQNAGVRVTMTRETDTTFSKVKATDLGKRVEMAKGHTVFVSIHSNAVPARNANNTYGLEVYYFNPRGAKPLYVQAAPPAETPTPEESPTSEAASNSTTPDSSQSIATLGEAAQNAVLQSGQTVPVAEQPKPTTELEPAAQPNVVTYTATQANPLASNSSNRTQHSKDLAINVMGQLLLATAANNRGVRSEEFYVLRNNTIPAVLIEMGYVTHGAEGPQFKNKNYLERLAHGISRGVLGYLDASALPSAD